MTIPHMLIQLVLPIAALILTSIDRALVHSGSLILPGMAHTKKSDEVYRCRVQQEQGHGSLAQQRRREHPGTG